MKRLLACAVLLYSFFDIRNAQPSLSAQVASVGASAGAALSLWISFGVELFVCCTFLLVPLVARSMPEAVHFGWRRLSDYSPRQLERVIPVLVSMTGMMTLATSLLLGIGIHMRIRSALNDIHAHPPILLVYGALLVSFILITYYYGERMDEVAGEG